MNSKLFLIHWNASEAEEHARKIRLQGWDIEIEAVELILEASRKLNISSHRDEAR